jgi:hypothetical protein
VKIQKLISLSLLPIFFILLSPAACTTSPPGVPGGGTFGALTWSDEFAGPAIDTTRWYVKSKPEGDWPDMPWRRDYKSGDAYIENGALVLRTRREGTAAAPSFSTGALAK